MNAPDQDVAKKVKDWVSYADDDLRLAKNTLETSSRSKSQVIIYWVLPSQFQSHYPSMDSLFR